MSNEPAAQVPSAENFFAQIEEFEPREDTLTHIEYVTRFVAEGDVPVDRIDTLRYNLWSLEADLMLMYVNGDLQISEQVYATALNDIYRAYRQLIEKGGVEAGQSRLEGSCQSKTPPKVVPQ